MASTRKESLAARMAPPLKAAGSQESAKTTPGAAGSAKAVLDESFTSTVKEFSKRLTVDITEEQHRKLLLKSIEQGKKMNPMIRDWIDSL